MSSTSSSDAPNNLFDTWQKNEKPQCNVAVAIDFGTTGTDYVLVMKPDDQNKRPLIVSNELWGSENAPSSGHNGKVPTIVLMEPEGKVAAFGRNALKLYAGLKAEAQRDWLLFRGMKGILYGVGAMPTEGRQKCDTKKQLPEKGGAEKKEEAKGATKKTDTKRPLEAERDEQFDDLLVEATNGRREPAWHVFSATFAFLRTLIEDRVMRLTATESRSALKIFYVVTVPVVWQARAHAFMSHCLKLAGFPMDRVKLAPEPDMALLGCQMQIEENPSWKAAMGPQISGDLFAVLDCGGGTVDISAHRVAAAKMPSEMRAMCGDITRFAEATWSTGGRWGSDYINLAFVQLLDATFKSEHLADFKQNNPRGWGMILDEIETMKLSVRPGYTGLYTMQLPPSFMDHFGGAPLIGTHFLSRMNQFLSEAMERQKDTADLDFHAIAAEWKEKQEYEDEVRSTRVPPLEPTALETKMPRGEHKTKKEDDVVSVSNGSEPFEVIEHDGGQKEQPVSASLSSSSSPCTPSSVAPTASAGTRGVSAPAPASPVKTAHAARKRRGSRRAYANKSGKGAGSGRAPLAAPTAMIFGNSELGSNAQDDDQSSIASDSTSASIMQHLKNGLPAVLRDVPSVGKGSKGSACESVPTTTPTKTETRAVPVLVSLNRDNQLEWLPAVVENMMKPVLNQICKGLLKLLARLDGQVGKIYLVGGFADSQFLQKQIGNVLDSHAAAQGSDTAPRGRGWRLFHPKNPSRQVVLGAVCEAYMHCLSDESVFKERVCRHALMVSVGSCLKPAHWRDGRPVAWYHLWSARGADSRLEKKDTFVHKQPNCEKLAHYVVNRNEIITASSSSRVIETCPAEASQSGCSVVLYATDKNGETYVDHAGAVQLAVLELRWKKQHDIPAEYARAPIETTVFFFNSSEIGIQVKWRPTGELVRTTITWAQADAARDISPKPRVPREFIRDAGVKALCHAANARYYEGNMVVENEEGQILIWFSDNEWRYVPREWLQFSLGAKIKAKVLDTRYRLADATIVTRISDVEFEVCFEQSKKIQRVHLSDIHPLSSPEEDY